MNTDPTNPQEPPILPAGTKARAMKAPTVEAEPSLRDRFAMAALTGMLAQSSEVANGYTWANGNSEQQVSEYAYNYADAMLEAREATP